MTNYSIPSILTPYLRENSIVVRSPGRINLIGEHTDYNEGFVLPAAIDKAVFLVLNPLETDEIILHAADLGESYTTSITNTVRPASQVWPLFLLGVVEQFKQVGVTLKGFEAALTSDIPIGAGLSSSAAVECAMAMALNTYTGAGLDHLTLVQLAQKAENYYVGVMCGIMDQFASMFGKKDHVLQLDCRSLEYHYYPFRHEGVSVILFDSGVKHSLGDSEYNLRRKQCEKGVALVQQQLPGIKSLRDVTLQQLNSFVYNNDPLTYIRCRYVVEEIQRLKKACQDLERGDLVAFGSRMYETHFGLSKMYEVSCAELDILVDHVSHLKPVLGARMMGGGFGGCTINLIREDEAAAVIEQTIEKYKTATGKDLKTYIVQIEAGTCIIC